MEEKKTKTKKKKMAKKKGGKPVPTITDTGTALTTMITKTTKSAQIVETRNIISQRYRTPAVDPRLDVMCVACLADSRLQICSVHARRWCVEHVPMLWVGSFADERRIFVLLSSGKSVHGIIFAEMGGSTVHGVVGSLN